MSWLTDVWNQWTFLTAGLVLLFSLSWMRPRFGTAASLLFACVCYSAIYTWIFVANRYVRVDIYNQMALRYFAADSVAKLFLVLAPLMALSDQRWTFRLIGEVLCTNFVLASSVVALIQWAMHGCADNACGGLVGNPSISMGAMVCMLPLSVRSLRQWPMLILTGAAVLASRSSIALGLYGLLFGWLLVKELDGLFIRVGLGLSAFASVLLAGRLALGAELTDSSGRFVVWKYMMHSWNQPWNLFQGTGFGTYHVLSIILQHWGGPNGPRSFAGRDWWDSFHNDFLQMLFECGAVGFVLLLCTYLSALFKLHRERDYAMLASAALYGIYMCVNPALHHAIPAVFGAWLFVYALRREPTKEYL